MNMRIDFETSPADDAGVVTVTEVCTAPGLPSEIWRIARAMPRDAVGAYLDERREILAALVVRECVRAGLAAADVSVGELQQVPDERPSA